MVNARKQRILEGFTQKEDDLPMTTDKDYDPKLKAFMTLIDEAFAELVNSIDMNTEKGDQALKYVFGATTTLCKFGNARMALEKLDERYDIKDADEMGDLQKEYETATL